MSEGFWKTETLHRDFQAGYFIRRVLAEKRTPFQHVELVESPRFGRMLWLDGIVQTTEADEFIYHEMMTHPALLSHPAPRRVLIVGGGDGGALREVLRHPTVERAVLVEIDAEVVAFCREQLGSIHQGSFDDPRTELVIADGAQYVRDCAERFDVAIVDSSDPIGPAEVLFGKDFYRNIAGLLESPGILVCQTGSTMMQPDEQPAALTRLGEVFDHNALYLFDVPTYVGGQFSATFSSREIDPLAISASSIEERAAALGGGLRYYNPNVHVAALQLPEHLKGTVAK